MDQPTSSSPRDNQDNGVALSEQSKRSNHNMNITCTKYLCAAVYENLSFARSVISELLLAENYGDFSAVAPSPQLDLVLLAKHAQQSDNVRMLVNFLVTLLSLIVIVCYLIDASQSHGLITIAGIFSIIAATAILMLEKRWRRLYIIRDFKRSNAFQNINIKLPEKIEKKLIGAHNANIYYYGSVNPFVGSGKLIHSWSFALNTSAQDVGESVEKESYSVNELYDSIDEAIGNLDLDNTIIQDVLCVNGSTLKENPIANKLLPLLDQPPIPTFSKEIMPSVSGDHCRRYKCVRTTAWNGDLVLSIFLRITRSKYLFIETSYYLLTPLGMRYKRLDDLEEGFSLWKWLIAVCHNVNLSFLYLIFSPLYLLYRIWEPLSHGKDLRGRLKSIKLGDRCNYGAKSSIRENCSYPSVENYLQLMDKEMLLKMTEKSILDTIRSFLKSRGEDISEFEKRQTTIVNHGLVVSGGDVKTRKLNIGQQIRSYIKGDIGNDKTKQ